MSRTRLVLFQRGDWADGRRGNRPRVHVDPDLPALAGRCLDTPVQALANPLVRVQAAGELVQRDRPDIAFHPVGILVVMIDQGRVGPQVVKPPPDGVGDPAFLSLQRPESREPACHRQTKCILASQLDSTRSGTDRFTHGVTWCVDKKIADGLNASGRDSAEHGMPDDVLTLPAHHLPCHRTHAGTLGPISRPRSWKSDSRTRGM